MLLTCFPHSPPHFPYRCIKTSPQNLACSQMLPKIEKRRTEDRQARLEVQKEGADRTVDSHTKHTASLSTQVPTQRPPSPKAVPQSPTSVPQSPKSAPQSPTSVPQSPKASKLQDCKPPPPSCTTPRGKVEGLVEEELIISPNSYTPLLATRQKRRRMVDSPVMALEKALAASVLVEESPETTRASATPSSGDAPLSVAERKGDEDSQASNEIASFLAEDDLVEIQESFIEEDAETCSLINREAGDKGDGSSSDAAEPSGASEDAEPIRMMKNKRRSVCRRVAVIESSEDEEEDEENKENIHPSFCNSSYRSRQTEEEEEEEEERADREQEAEEDEEYDDDAVDGTDETDEMDGADEVGEEEDDPAEAREEADGSVVVYDESMSEDREGEPLMRPLVLPTLTVLSLCILLYFHLNRSCLYGSFCTSHLYRPCLYGSFCTSHLNRSCLYGFSCTSHLNSLVFMDPFVLPTSTGLVFMDPLVLPTLTGLVFMDSLVLPTLTGLVFMDSLVLPTLTGLVFMDSLVLPTLTGLVFMDSLVLPTLTGLVFMDSLVLPTLTVISWCVLLYFPPEQVLSLCIFLYFTTRVGGYTSCLYAFSCTSHLNRSCLYKIFWTEVEQVACFNICFNSCHFNQIKNSLILVIALCVNLCIDVHHRLVESTQWSVVQTWVF